MYKTSYIKAINKQQKQKKLLLIGIFLLLVIFASFGILAYLAQKENIVLQRTWQSDETGVVLTFTSEGKVLFKDDATSGTYHIISQNTMEYSIDGKTFLMKYEIVQKDKKLYWGTDNQHLECFTLKQGL